MKKAIKRLVRGDDGQLRIIYIDLETLQEVTNLSGYTVVSAGSASEEPDPVADVKNPSVPSQTQENTKAIENNQRYGGGGNALNGRRPPERPRTPTQKTPSATQKASRPSTPSTPSAPSSSASVSPSGRETPVIRESLPPVMTDPVREARDEKSFMTRDLQKPVGKQVAGLAPGVGLIEDYGPRRPYAPAMDVLRPVSESLQRTLGAGYSIKGISGQEKELPQYGSHRHKTGTAIDFDVIGPDGKQVTDPVEIQKVALDFVKQNPDAGIGFGDGYMAKGRAHFDLAGSPAAWGADGKSENMSNVFAREVELARQGRDLNPPIPESPSVYDRLSPPVPTEKPSFMEAGFGSGTLSDKTTAQKVIEQAKNPVSVASEMEDFSKASPARLAAAGLIDRNQAQIDMINRTIAGEMSGASLRALEMGDPTALQEYANIVTTIENRAQSKVFGSLDSALSGSQYNANLDKNKSVTDDNFRLFKTSLQTAYDAFRSGSLSPTSWNLSSYYNPSLVAPSWGLSMSDKAQVGDHYFGTLGTYRPSDAFMDYRDNLSAYSQRDSIGTFGTSNSPGVGRSSLDTSDPYSGRAGKGTFGTTSSPGYGRSSFSESGGGGALGGVSNHSAERERDTSLAGRSSSGNNSGGIGSNRDQGPRQGGGISSGGTTNRDQGPRQGGGGFGGTSSGRSPTNDGYAGSKTPGGGF